ncbi:hypothetical protein AVEN_177718-1 [Araneus ventricosus]|uniref:Uncharacterized protein n=1 Tax=Araneus ventricosus TaxID=182803 RepID=A0A4Y2M6P8_ARAVE|nr:hypothetical protein AVEN_177718-1 [Araneus ventricosus]
MMGYFFESITNGYGQEVLSFSSIKRKLSKGAIPMSRSTIFSNSFFEDQILYFLAFIRLVFFLSVLWIEGVTSIRPMLRQASMVAQNSLQESRLLLTPVLCGLTDFGVIKSFLTLLSLGSGGFRSSVWGGVSESVCFLGIERDLLVVSNTS